MIQSMTGYGEAIVNYGGKKIHVEVKSLNSKSFDLFMRVPPIYKEKEIALRQTLSQQLQRGKIDLTIWVEKDVAVEAPQVKAKVLVSYYEQLKEVVDHSKIPEPADWMSVLLRLPETTARNEMETLEEEEWKTISDAVNTALEHLTAFRTQEGSGLEKMFQEKISNIRTLLHQIETYETSRVEKIKSRLLESLKGLHEVQYDNNRLEQELIYYIEKLDISEEKQRLNNHLDYFVETMDNAPGQGKKLGFVAQEMGREINTMGSKSNLAEMQNIVVEMKDELEQIKEQVLNVL